MRNTKRKNSGFTIVEMLMAMTITAMLLTALAASINATMVNINANRDSYKAINNARQALSRMCAELRTSQGVEPSEADNLCSSSTADGDVIIYKFDADNGVLNLNKDGVDYLMCEGVESMTFTKGLDPENPLNVRNVQISMTIKIGDVTKKLSTATVIMINMP
jgi:prepilin-type N-terminal cleavage/methylation domain-containing protein